MGQNALMRSSSLLARACLARERGEDVLERSPAPAAPRARRRPRRRARRRSASVAAARSPSVSFFGEASRGGATTSPRGPTRVDLASPPSTARRARSAAVGVAAHRRPRSPWPRASRGSSRSAPRRGACPGGGAARASRTPRPRSGCASRARPCARGRARARARRASRIWFGSSPAVGSSRIDDGRSCDDGVGQPDALPVALRQVRDALVGDVERRPPWPSRRRPTSAAARRGTRFSSARKRRYSTTRISG